MDARTGEAYDPVMRAIVLVGGEGTRLRPLTWRTAKALVPVLNRPLLDHLLLNLRDHGVTRVTLALTKRNEAIRAAFGDGSRLGLSVEYAYEDKPLGSGGAIASIAGGWDETFLVCNGDIITSLDISAMIEAHRARGAELSLSLHRVDDPSPFGVVEIEPDGRILRFVEKPKREEAPSHLINAGTWLFEPSLLAQMDGTTFNRVEDTLFPALCAAGRPVYGFPAPSAMARTDWSPSYWADVGNPAALLRVNLDMVTGALPDRLPAPPPIDGVLLGEGVTVAADAVVRGPAVIGAHSRIEAGAQVAGSVLWDRVVVGAGARVSGSTLASGVHVGAGAVVEDSVVAHGAQVAPNVRLERAAVEPAAATEANAR